MRLPISLLTSILLLLAVVLAGAAPANAQLLPGLGGSSGADAEADVASSVDPVQLLLEVLQDDGARARLVEALKATDVAPAEPEAEAKPLTFVRRIAGATEAVVKSVVASVQRSTATIARAPRILDGFTREEVGVIVDALRELFFLIATTMGLFVALRAAALPFYRRTGKRAAEATFAGHVAIFFATGLMDFAIVFAVWATGSAVALLVFGESDEMGLRQVLYLNAFLIVELIKAVFRLIVSPAAGELRPLNVSDRAARRLYRFTRVQSNLLGYGFLLVLPIVAGDAGWAGKRSTTVIIWLLAIAHATACVIIYRRPVADWLFRQFGGKAKAARYGDTRGDTTSADEGSPKRSTRFGRGLANAWYLLALAWLFWLLVTVLGRGQGGTVALAQASAKVAVVLIAGLLLSGLLGAAMTRGISLPLGMNERVPLLERRLNRYVPRILLVIRIGIIAGVLLYAFDTLDIVSTGNWIVGEIGLRATGVIVSVGFVVLMAFAAWLTINSWVDYRLNPSYGTVPTAREQTLLTLLRNAATIAIVLLALMFAMSEIGLNIGPLLASAGVVGLAIGFGAQKMVQDIITGIFIQFENAINVGDVVSAGGTTGTVERLTVRSVSLRDLSGVYHIIPFSSVDTVSNYMRDFSYYLLNMGVGYRENVPHVKQAMFDAFEDLRADPEQAAFILGDLEWFGLDSFADNAVVLRCRVKTWPGQQWGVGRAYNEILKRIFDERNIDIPVPQQTIWFGEDRQGHAIPMRVSGQMETTPPPVQRPPRPADAPEGTVPPTQDGPPDAGDN